MSIEREEMEIRKMTQEINIKSCSLKIKKLQREIEALGRQICDHEAEVEKLDSMIAELG